MQAIVILAACVLTALALGSAVTPQPDSETSTPPLPPTKQCKEDHYLSHEGHCMEVSDCLLMKEAAPPTATSDRVCSFDRTTFALVGNIFIIVLVVVVWCCGTVIAKNQVDIERGFLAIAEQLKNGTPPAEIHCVCEDYKTKCIGCHMGAACFRHLSNRCDVDLKGDPSVTESAMSDPNPRPAGGREITDGVSWHTEVD